MPNAKLASKRTGVVTASRLCGLLVRPVGVEHGKNQLAACKRWCAQTTELASPAAVSGLGGDSPLRQKQTPGYGASPCVHLKSFQAAIVAVL
jgi:hypothetical protein